MRKVQLVTGHYEGKDSSIIVWYRDENFKKDFVKIVGFEPHFFVEVNSRIPDDPRFRNIEHPDVPGIYGEKLWRLNVSDPASVSGVRGGGGLRDMFERHWEADVRYVDRLLTNIGVKGGFTFAGGRRVHFRDVKPVEFMLYPVVCFLDIECLTKTRFPNAYNPKQPIISSTVWDSVYKTYMTFMYDPPVPKKREKVGNWIKIYCGSEEEVIKLTQEYFDKVKPDVISGWNIGFDVNYFKARAKRMNIHTNLRFACIFDLMKGYEFLHKSLGKRLKDVVVEEGIAEEVVSEEFHIEFWEDPETRPMFMLYNKKDVEYCVMLDSGFTDVRDGKEKQYDIVKRFWDLKNFVGKSDMEKMTHGLVIDQLLLRKAHGRYILPSRPPKGKRGKSFRAAVVFEPAEGVFGNKEPYDGTVDPDKVGIGVLDMSRYYPNILKAYYKKRLRFSSDPNENLFPEIIDDLMGLRERFEKIMLESDFESEEYKNAKRMRDVVKSPLLSGIWGYIGWGGSRIYDREKAEFIAGKAREGLEIARKESEEIGYPIIYGDTDSVFSMVTLNNVGELLEKLNEVFKEYCEKEGIPQLLEIKMDRFYRTALWVEAEDKDRAAKKRYMGHCVIEGDKRVDYIDTKGFELIRGDSSKITRRLQADVGDAILRKGTSGLVGRIKKLVNDMKNEVFSYDDVAIAKNLHKKIEKPKVDYYRGARYGNKYMDFGIEPGDRIKMLYVTRVKGYPSTDVLCYLDQDKLPELAVNWSKMIDRTVKRKVKRLLKIVGMDWLEIEGFKPLENFFGDNKNDHM